MKILKKLLNSVLSLVLFCTCLFIPFDRIHAKTLGDLKAELNKQIEEFNNTKNQKELTEKQITNIKSNISSIYKQIEDNQNTVVELGEQIEQLKEDIVKREEEIKDIVRFYQQANGESVYLEYIFSATTYTDFIYRLAISEQLTKYNKELVDEHNRLIEESKKKQKELQNMEADLVKKQGELNQQLDSLGDKLTGIIDLTVDIEEDIKVKQEAIRLYEQQYKCKDSDEISVCTADKLPADTSFWRPLVTGHRSSEYGYRTYYLGGKKVTDFHTGLDITTYPNSNVPVYAAAAGKVVGIVTKASCGGNKIYINHTINGKKYTTAYVHLRRILVSVGDTVTKDTQIAVMGGDPSIETWDGCSTGAHLHFMVADGWYLKDYTSWNTFVSKTYNPRNIVNFPSGGNTFYNRTTKY